ncbi:helix-turn-helix domain-containing protein [Pseudoduganella albidiflava]|uniref:AraC family transcriptional regulator n=1 Tax=Pseudoduganella albidiflava TaxID=321983 RepID=A0A411X020_9BURK|nr:helix-turn-helix domain-containing protein [Pseudoduganella albidiflava]QBI02357.1 helix-turn-helix domain-containing protein [Pseudoduganella albidiflava]GGY43440.1 AraC family transcriptional regulator [Pseudoduganella albidiflava]
MHQIETTSAPSCLAAEPGLPVEPGILRRVTADDADDLARHLTGWEQVYDQITCGAFVGALDEWQLPGVQVFRERINQSVHQACRVREDALWFGLPLELEASRINGRKAGAATVMARPGGKAFELVTPRDHDIYGIVVSRGLCEERARQLGCEEGLAGLDGAEILRVDPAARGACLRMLSALLDGAREGDGCDEASAEATRHRVVDTLLRMLGATSIEAAALKSQQRRRGIVAKCRDYLYLHRDRAVSIPELCEHACVSRRTLQYCFEDVLGVSPVVYLRRLRLNAIRRMLRDEPPHARGIGRLAADWGIDNFSQFSSDYKKLFGKTPSACARGAARPG